MFVFFFFHDTATPEIYTLSLHDALPIFGTAVVFAILLVTANAMMMSANERTGEVAVLKTIGYSDRTLFGLVLAEADRKSTRLNSSHSQISYAVFCLKKKKKHTNNL